MNKIKKLNCIDIFIIIVVCLIALLPYIYNKSNSKKQPNFQEEKVIVTIKFENVWEEFLENLVVGANVNMINDQNQGKIITVETSPPRTMVMLYDLENDKIGDSETIDIKLKIELETNIINSHIRFNDQEIKVGLPFVLKSPNIQLSGTINDIEVIE